MAKKSCKICGEEGYLYYPYCYKHFQEYIHNKTLYLMNKKEKIQMITLKTKEQKTA